MAIVQISQITNRKGLNEDLPQPLAGAELGWSVDTRQLYIGNGTLAEGAPVVGNTEILTEFSDIFSLPTNYTYKGDAATGYTVQTGPTPGSPITQSLQSWFDQWATVKDFGAIGDGITDDTDAINRALFQIYCREVNPQIRRAIFFPAGTYRVTSTILIPPYATLYGEGIDNTRIVMDNSNDDSTLVEYVARTTDSLQQYGVNIGSNGAIIPQFVTVSNMSFVNQDPTTNVFLIEDASYCNFRSVGFFGPLTTSNLTTDGNDSSGIRFASTPTLVCNQIVFDGCEFSGTTYGLTTATAQGGTDQQTNGVTVANSKFETLFNGVCLGTETPVSGGATGFRITSNQFDVIYHDGIIFGAVNLNATGYNIFYDVGNEFGGITTPVTPIITITNNNTVSVGDMFARTDAYSTTVPRILLSNNSSSIAITNAAEIAVGSYVIGSGQTGTLTNNTLSATTITNTSSVQLTVDATQVRAFVINYTIVRDVGFRTGSFTVATGSSNLTYSDEYTENLDIGIALSAIQSVNTVSVQYTSTNTGVGATITYSVTHLA